MKIGLKVSYNDGKSKDVEAVFADFVAFERTWNRSITQFETELRLTDLAWLAWHSEKRRKQTALGFEPDWIESVQGIEAQPDDNSGADIPLAQVQPTD
jgi:hypothetical protein